MSKYEGCCVKLRPDNESRRNVNEKYMNMGRGRIN